MTRGPRLACVLSTHLAKSWSCASSRFLRQDGSIAGSRLRLFDNCSDFSTPPATAPLVRAAFAATTPPSGGPSIPTCSASAAGARRSEGGVSMKRAMLLLLCAHVGSSCCPVGNRRDDETPEDDGTSLARREAEALVLAAGEMAIRRGQQEGGNVFPLRLRSVPWCCAGGRRYRRGSATTRDEAVCVHATHHVLPSLNGRVGLVGV